MPQVFQVLKCYKCLVFQIHQMKKSNKFQCKVCGEQQSIKRHYGIGTGKDCRLHVQRLNGIRGEMEIVSHAQRDSDTKFEDSKVDEHTLENINDFSNNSRKRSKWLDFVDKEEEITEEPTKDPMFLGDKEVILEMPQKRKIKKFKVKPKYSNKLNEDLNTLTSSSVTSESNWSANNIDNLEPKHKILKIVQDSSQNKSNTHFKSITASNKQTSEIKKEVLMTKGINSKWAQFVATEEETESTCDDTLSNLKHDKILCKAEKLFSLCDDSDLDQVLDI